MDGDGAGELALGIHICITTTRERAVISQKGKSSLSRPLSADGKVRKDIIITYTNSLYLNLSYLDIPSMEIWHFTNKITS